MSGELPLTENNRRRPKVVVNVWQNVFIISAIKDGSRGVQRSGDALGKCLIVSPPTKVYAIEEREKYRHSKTTCPDLCQMQRIATYKLCLKK